MPVHHDLIVPKTEKVATHVDEYIYELPLVAQSYAKRMGLPVRKTKLVSSSWDSASEEEHVEERKPVIHFSTADARKGVKEEKKDTKKAPTITFQTIPAVKEKEVLSEDSDWSDSSDLTDVHARYRYSHHPVAYHHPVAAPVTHTHHPYYTHAYEDWHTRPSVHPLFVPASRDYYSHSQQHFDIEPYYYPHTVAPPHHPHIEEIEAVPAKKTKKTRKAKKVVELSTLSESDRKSLTFEESEASYHSTEE